MSKKNKKNKLKSQIKTQIFQEMNQTAAVDAAKSLPTEKAKIKNELAIEKTASLDAAIKNLPQIIYDLKKTGIIVTSTAIIIGGIAYFDTKYHYLIKVGDWIFKLLHIN